MEWLEESLAQYEAGCEKMQGRIEELTQEINRLRWEGHAIRDLLDRRYALYVELGEMHHAIGALKDYLKRVQVRQTEEGDLTAS